MDDALCDDGLLAALLWLDAPALEAAERVCRRWRRLVLSTPMCRAHRPRARVWERLGDRAAVVAERIAEHNWRAGRYERKEVSSPGSRVYHMVLDGPRLAMCADEAVDVFDASNLAAPLWHVDVPGVFRDAAMEEARLALFARPTSDHRHVALYAGAPAAGALGTTDVRLEMHPGFTTWRGAQIAYVAARDGGRTVHRVDAASGRVARSLPLLPTDEPLPRMLDMRSDVFALADGTGVGVVTRPGLRLDDGR